jgi:alpha-tubulin suppressor-like RCC1 family protein
MSLSAIPASVGGGDGNLHWSNFSCRGESTLAVRSDGSLWGWGSGVLDSQSSFSIEPVRIGRDSDWVKASAGGGEGGTNAAIKADGSLWLWGSNFLGMLGAPVPEFEDWGPFAGFSSIQSLAFYAPRSVGGYDWSDVSVGGNHVMAVKRDGTLWGWGSRAGAALGDGLQATGDTRAYPDVQPVPVRIGTDNDWVAVKAGDVRSLGLKADGSLWRWGWWAGRAILLPQRVGSSGDRWTAFSLSEHALAVREDGSLWSFGRNDYGQLGTGDRTDSDAPVLVGAGPWKDAAAGARHSLAIRTDGSLWAWGDNEYGILGIGTLSPSLLPVRVGGATDWVMAGAGGDFSCVLKAKNPDGKLWLWGGNYHGQLGNRLAGESDAPVRAESGSADFVKAIAGGGGTFGLRADGTLWGWGANGNGQLGDNTLLGRQLPAPTAGGGLPWLDIAGGGYHTLGIRTDGSLWSWGGNTYGEQGSGIEGDRLLPGRIGAATWKAVFAGWQSSFAIRADGTLWAWGLDTYNRLGIGNSFDPGDSVSPAMAVASPRQVGSSGGWKQLSSSMTQTAAVRDDGSLWCWGTGLFGALGNGVLNTGVPVRVGTDNDWASVATSGYHMAALKRDGSLWAWGSNAAGEIGDGTYGDRDAPVRIGSAAWRSVAVRDRRTIGVRDDGTLWAWGGMIPEYPAALPAGSNVPVRVGNGTRWVSVTASDGGLHWVAMQTDGGIFTWGSNYSGQLGNLVAWTPYPVWIP